MELHTSETILDTTNSSTNNELSLSFDIANGGTETVYVDDKLLTNYDVAKARAESIFLDEGYVTKRVTFSTYHIDNLHIGDTIQLDGLLFKVINIVDKIKGAVVSMDITAERVAKSAIVLDVKVILVTAIGETNKVISHSDGYMYAISYSNGNIFRSIDGETWVQVFTSGGVIGKTIVSHSDGYVYSGIYFSPSIKTIYRSNDGITWTDVYTSDSGIELSVSNTDGYVYFLEISKVVRSNDGITWSSYTTSHQSISTVSHGGHLYSFGYLSGVFSIYISTDGLSWSNVATLATARPSGLISVNGFMYGYNGSGQIWRSADGITWDLVFDNIAYESSGMAYLSNDGCIYSCCIANQVIKSSDGLTWEEIYIAPTASELFAIVAHDTFIMAFDYIGNGYKLEYIVEVE